MTDEQAPDMTDEQAPETDADSQGGSGTSGDSDELERQAGAYARDAEQADQDTDDRAEADPRAS